ncbi:heterokaryon incompatibility protein-domain-containing protein [Staphylotrichum tortipilum]|uniref:Heterokaryon incompatibility protein-domain-containing protein n=1 Tax=Staphylotrichum tortipilum TaxID=2831512 RepID=A0AAN6MTX1_9PEZI|nr:heterokaryon incompatibility protein-domain-containing protein [Staphylotrichum longicolle]
MPLASCQPCLALYSSSIEVCRCDASVTNCHHWRPHHTEISSLCHSALIGCRLCRELWHYFFREKAPEQYAEEPWFTTGNAMHAYMNSGVRYRVLDMTGQPIARAAGPVAAMNDETDADPATILALSFALTSQMVLELQDRQFFLRRVNPIERLVTMLASGILDTGGPDEQRDPSENRWALVRRWLATCETQHPSCSRAIHANAAAPWFPTRLIVVQPTPGPDGHDMYPLIETATTAPIGNRYLTLSHVWGSGPENQAPAYRTLPGNYTDRITAGIRRDALPPCFVDAIDVARRLGVPYLWIDSLCIIQENAADWAAEAGRMSAVYANSFLNLSATASSSSRDRFPALDERQHEPRFVGTAWPEELGGLYQVFDPLFWDDRVTSTRLASRGWIFQERALAPRVLHFARDQLMWECAGLEAAEEFPLGVPRRFISAGKRAFKWEFDFTSPLPSPPSPAAANESLHKTWSTALLTYTSSSLTQPRDKLVAISGVARALAAQHSLPEAAYHAGLWQNNLPGDLCWRVPEMRRATQELVPSGLYARRWGVSERVEGRAPSWAWASVEGCVVPGPFGGKWLVKVGQVRLEMEGGDGFGGVKPGGRMEVEGGMCRLTAEKDARVPVERVVVRYAARGEGEVWVELDQLEGLEVLGRAWFLPVLEVQRRVEVQREVTVEEEQGQTQAVGESSRSGWRARLKEKGKGLLKRDSGRLPKRASVQASGPAGGKPGGKVIAQMVDQSFVMGIVVVPTDDGKSYRRVGFHECPAMVLDTLRPAPEGDYLEQQFTLV